VTFNKHKTVISKPTCKFFCNNNSFELCKTFSLSSALIVSLARVNILLLKFIWLFRAADHQEVSLSEEIASKTTCYLGNSSTTINKKLAWKVSWRTLNVKGRERERERERERKRGGLLSYYRKNYQWLTSFAKDNDDELFGVWIVT